MHALTPGQFAEVDALFHEAAGLGGAARDAFVTSVRLRSPALAPHLEAMLRADAADSRDVDAIVADGARAAMGGAADESLIGARFGAYRVDRVIGHGGMGAVFLGTRADHEFHQTVAIKIIRAGRESAGGLGRFRREREILARLDHPGIARLIDGGTGPHGIPFVAMEYVEGEPLMAYVTDHAIALRPRLDLFLELCEAVDFVHRRLVVHQDIKPGNVLVTADGHVKLLDFGISRLTDEFGSSPGETATLQRAMTPEYASPEQIQGNLVTTATDVYALGVLLYELVTGERPVRWNSSNPFELARAIVTEVPAPPSEAVRRAAAPSIRLPDTPKKLARQLAGDMDRVVLTAIRKEPERRYPSVAALAADVRAWMTGRPVAAQPDTLRYRVRKFVGRHPAATAAALGFAAVVVTFTTVTLRQSHALAKERDGAIVAERQATANADFLTKVFTTADPRHAGNKNVTAFDLLRSGLSQLEGDHSVDLRVRANLYLTLGRALVNLEEFDEGIGAIRRSLAETERAYGHESNETAEVLSRLGDALREAGHVADAYSPLAESVAIRRRLLLPDSPDLADSYNNLAIVTNLLGRYREADDLLAASLAIQRRLNTPDDPTSLPIAINNLALLRRRQGLLAESLAMAEQAYGMLQRHDDQNSTLWALGTIGGIRGDMGQLSEAAAIFQRALTKYRELVPPTHTRILTKERDLAHLRYLQGDYASAEKVYTTLENTIRRSRGERSEQMALVLTFHALLDRDLGRLADAERLQREALADELAVTVATDYHIPILRRDLADVLIDRGKRADAESQLRQSLAILPDPKTMLHIERARTDMSLARLQTIAGQWDEAGALLKEARTIVLATTGDGSLDMGVLLLREGLLLEARGDLAAAANRVERSERVLAHRLPPLHHDRAAAEQARRRLGRRIPNPLSPILNP